MAKKVFDGILSPKRIDMFRPLVHNTFKDLIREEVDQRLTNAIKIPKEETETKEEIMTVSLTERTKNKEKSREHVEQALEIIQEIASEIIDKRKIKFERA